MAQAHSSILTLVSAGLAAFHQQVNVLMAQREADCATGLLFARNLAYSASGDATGGGGSGSSGDPYAFRHAKDLHDFLNTHAADSDTAWLLNRGDTFDGRGGVASLVYTGTNAYFGTYGSGNQPVVTDFTPENTLVAGAWTSLGSGRFSKPITAIDLTWIRYDEAPATNLEVGTENVFTRMGSAAAVTAGNQFFQDPATKVLTVHCSDGLTPAGRIQIARSTVKLFHLQGAGTKIEAITLLGGGMQDGSNFDCCLILDTNGTNSMCAIGCRTYYSAPHFALGYASAAGAGGYSLWKNCRGGLCYQPAAGDAIGVVHYNGSGGQEFYIDGFDFQYGTLPDAGQRSRRGSPFDWHTGGAPTIALAIVRNATSRNHTYGWQTNGLGQNAPVPTTYTHMSEYRVFIINETHEGGVGTTFQFSDRTGFIRINDNLSCAPSDDATYGWTTANGFVGPSNATKGIWIGGKWQISLANLGAGTWRFCANSAAPLGHLLLGIGLHVQVTGSGSNSFSWDGVHDSAGFDSQYCRWFRCIFAYTGMTGSPPAQQFAPNQGAGTTQSNTPTGGMTDCAFWDSRDPGTAAPQNIYKPNFVGGGGPPPVAGSWYGVGSGTGYVELTSLPSIGGSPNAQLLGAATHALPTGCAVDYWIDSNKQIHMMPTTPSIGPVQASTQLSGTTGITGVGAAVLSLMGMSPLE